MADLSNITSEFGVYVSQENIVPLGSGLINDTYKVTTPAGEPDYVLQRINHKIFNDVEMLQNNIDNVTAHIRNKLIKAGEKDIDRKSLRFIKSKSDGKSYVKSGDEYWRMMFFIPDSFTNEVVDEKSAELTGIAFGEFQTMLSDIRESIGETIPDFHNMEFRLKQFKDSINADSAGRLKLKDVNNLVDELLLRSEKMTIAERLYREGKLPKRICHCDTKVNNILFDEKGEILCVIDLDTVMPSFVFSDFGDFLRSAANTGEEDAKNLDSVNFNMNIFRAFARGYVSAASFLTPLEKEMLPYAALLFPYMQAVRFLTDYLNGDTYYKTAYPDHNLVRAKAQFKLLQSAESCEEAMREYISSLN